MRNLRLAVALPIIVLSASNFPAQADPQAPFHPSTSSHSRSQSGLRSARWHLHVTASFRVFATSKRQAEQVADGCERLRRELREKWLGEKDHDPWRPCCDIVVHASSLSYTCAVGRAPGETSGCSTIRIENGRVLARRIDLRADSRDPLTAALPHEMTHVVLADRFLDRPLPRWADEGIALMADPMAKQAAHERDLHGAIQTGRRIRLASLLKMDEYPQGSVAAFYAQSNSLVRLLVERESAVTFVNFVDLAMKSGYPVALRDIYGLRSIEELETAWLQQLRASRSPPPPRVYSDSTDSRQRSAKGLI
jgi:hypothetical protein